MVSGILPNVTCLCPTVSKVTEGVESFIPILPSDVMRSLSATPEPDALVFNIYVEPPATYGPIDAAPASVTDISITPV